MDDKESQVKEKRKEETKVSADSLEEKVEVSKEVKEADHPVVKKIDKVLRKVDAALKEDAAADDKDETSGEEVLRNYFSDPKIGNKRFKTFERFMNLF